MTRDVSKIRRAKRDAKLKTEILKISENSEKIQKTLEPALEKFELELNSIKSS